jgi:hypothetical protein
VAALTAASALAGSELLYCVQGGADRKCTISQAATYVFSLVSGDCTAAAGGAITCLKTNGSAFSALATATPGTGVTIALGNNANASGGFPTVPVANAQLANAATTVNSQTCTLGSTCTVPAVTSIATGCQATGGTITTTGTISTQLTTSNTYTSNQNVASGDACHQVLLNDASAATLTFISANLTTGQYGRVINIGAGTWTLAAGTGVSAIKGCTSLAQNQSADWQFDGTNVNVACGAGSGASGANPSATAGASAVNGSATTFMRSDGAPAVQVGSASQEGIVQVDGTTITASAGTISTPGGANPSATAKDTANNGSATTFMRSDASPAIQKATSGQFGLVETDGRSINASSGVISTPNGWHSPYYITGGTQWYVPQTGMTTAIGVSITTGNLYCGFGGVPAQVTIKSLAVRTGTGQASSHAEVAIYYFASPPSTTMTLLDYGSAQQSTSSNNATVTFGSLSNTTDTLYPGVLYAFCINVDTSALTFGGYSSAGPTEVAAILGSATVANVVSTTQVSGKSIAQTYNSSPGTTFGTPGTTTITLGSMADITTVQTPIVAFLVN